MLPCLALALAAITLLSGFGLGTVLMPVFAIFFPIEVAIAATGVVHLVNNLFKVALVGKWADRGVSIRFGIPAIIFAFVGAAALTLLAPVPPLTIYDIGSHQAVVTVAKLVTAVLLIAFAALELLPMYRRLAFHSRLLPLGGALSGFFGGLTGMQGALRAPFLLRAGLDTQPFVGTTAVVSTGVDIARLLMYALGLTYLAKARDYGVLSEPRTIALVAVTCVAGCLGSWLAKRFLRHVTLGFIRAIVAAMLFVLGMLLGAGII